VSGNQYFIVGFTLDSELTVSEGTDLERRIDKDLVFIVFEGIRLSLSETEAPSFLVVGRAVRDPMGRIGKGEQMLSQLIESDFAVNGCAVVDDVKVALFEINDFDAFRIFDPGIADVPFLGDRPIERFGAGWNLK
jgi:hypothetical protein